MNTSKRVRLSVMMFFQYAIWGSWYVTMGTYLGTIGFQGNAIGSAYSTTGWAAIISPFFVGMIADRFLDAEKVLGLMHILGGIFLFWASRITNSDVFFWMLLLYTLCYMPTIALTNSISFHQMSDPGKEFPMIRVLGTIGWIAAGWAVSLLKIESTNLPMWIAAGTSVVFGMYCFFLPHTPPKSAGQKVTLRDILGLDALRLMKRKSFFIFVISSLMICIPLSFYFSFTNLFLNQSGIKNAAGIMTLGQMSEIVFMVVMPFFLSRLGIKKMLLMAMLFWGLRYVCFAMGNNETLYSLFVLAILFHGICYDFFFVTGQIYVDKQAPGEIRANAQGLLSLLTFGVGMMIGSRVSGLIVERYQILDQVQAIVGYNWRAIWLVPAAMAILTMLFFGLFFSEKQGVFVSEKETS